LILFSSHSETVPRDTGEIVRLLGSETLHSPVLSCERAQRRRKAGDYDRAHTRGLSRIVLLPARALTPDWLEKWNRSDAKFPGEIETHQYGSFEQVIREHRQFWQAESQGGDLPRVDCCRFTLGKTRPTLLTYLVCR
jgi:hypothetical protein